MRKTLLIPLAAMAFCGAPVSACMHPPRDYPGKLGSKVQEYFFYRTGPDIHMIMNQRIQSNLPLPDEVAWVTPLPAVPKEYFQEKDDFFETLFRATEPVMRGARSKSAPQGFIAHDTVKVGNYEIIPLEVIDTRSGSEINQWLEKNGYAKVPFAGLRYYLKPHACFLAIKVKGNRGKENTLHPLHVVYSAKEARLPLKFFAQAGALGLKSLQPDSSFIARYHGYNMNARWNRVSGWKEDPLLILD
jgi:hypothetical protein